MENDKKTIYSEKIYSYRPASPGEQSRAVASYREATGDKSRNVESPAGISRAIYSGPES